MLVGLHLSSKPVGRSTPGSSAQLKPNHFLRDKLQAIQLCLLLSGPLRAILGSLGAQVPPLHDAVANVPAILACSADKEKQRFPRPMRLLLGHAPVQAAGRCNQVVACKPCPGPSHSKRCGTMASSPNDMYHWHPPQGWLPHLCLLPVQPFVTVADTCQACSSNRKTLWLTQPVRDFQSSRLLA